MKACNNYSRKQKKKALLAPLPYAPLTIIIPCYDEPNISATLKSIWNCTGYKENLHVIVVVNHATNAPENSIAQNKATVAELREWQKNYATKLRHLSILQIVFSENESGVGAARKLGMDEVVSQYIQSGKDGVIISLDADTLCASNYLSEIFKHFCKYPKTNTLIIRYAHIFDNIVPAQKNAIIQYELYLRYMTLAYRYIGHPDAFHTIGSAFAVRASAYCKQGGMNRRQAGEDFYFIQKMLLLGNCHELNTTCVYPSARISARVPFGTGKAVKELMENNCELQTYSFKAFEELKVFFDKHLSLYKTSQQDYEQMLYNDLGGLIKSWLIEVDFFKELQQINNNCASETMFSKKFFETFSIFQIIKYLNFTHTHFLQKVGVFHAISCLPQANNFNFLSDETLLFSMRDELSLDTFIKQ